tara:strand:+ start:359 stop:1744 length:1386 start_codon:yes stop_codon:yes gene_type:complete
MTPYPSYRPHDLDGIEQVPEHWITWKVTHGFRLIGSGTTPKSDNSSYYGGDIPWVTTSELRENLITETKNGITYSALRDYSTLKLYQSGALAIAMYGATIGRLGIFGIPATTNQACCVFDNPEQFDIKFFFYWLWMQRPNLIALSVGGGQPNLSQDDLKKLRVPAPAISEQTQISRFLDYKTAQLDQLIAKKQALIERLNEQRIALITQAVTRGLNLDVPLKDSGVEWLGQVPEGWDLLKIKFLVTMTGGGTPNTSKKDYWNGDIPWVSPKDMKTSLISETIDYITEIGIAESSTKLIENPSVLIVVRSGILQHSIPVAINSRPVTLNQDMKALSTNPELLSTNYLYYFIEGLQSTLLPIWSKSGCTVESIETDYLMNTLLPVPSLACQAEITTYLEKKVKEISSLSDKARETINRLEEYRTALITAAVTGKIDVRDIQVPVTPNDGPTSENIHEKASSQA